MFLALEGLCALPHIELNKRERAEDGEETGPESVWLKTDKHILNSVHKQQKLIYVNSSTDGVWLSESITEHTIVAFQSKPGFFFYETKDLNGETLGVFYSGE